MTAVAERIGYAQPTTTPNGLTVTDLFCGAGGSSSGLVEAGYRVIIAANHWARAIESHQLNHPDTDHSSADISQVTPSYFPRTDILWASPECTNHSVAKGVKRQRAENEALFELEGTRPLADEAANRSRATMWDVPRFAEYHAYRAIIIENVVDAYRWVMFPAWLQAMELLGYEHELVWLNSMHAQGAGLPAPQSRDRMYIVFWRRDRSAKGAPRRPDIAKWTRPFAVCEQHGEIRAVQTFKKAEQWGRYRAQYVYRCPSCAVVVEPAWLPAASAIDFTNVGQRIGDRDKPLAEKTRERIRKGIERHWRTLVVEAAGNAYDSTNPRHPQYGEPTGYVRAWPSEEPLRTLHTSESKALAVPPLIVRGEGNDSGAKPSTMPIGAITASGSQFLASPLLVPVEGREGKVAAPASGPMRTQSTRNETALMIPAGGTWRDGAVPVSEVMSTRTTSETDALVVPLRNHGVAKPATRPIDTVSAEGNHHALVMTNNHANRVKSIEEVLPTATTATVHALLMRNNTARGDQGQMSTPVDEPMRALTTAGHQSLLEPGEQISLDVDDVLFRMLTPDEIKRGMAFADDYVLLGTKREQVKQAGNAVTPPAARDLGWAVAEFLNGEIIAAA
ncbi:DNA cytosine methyltransferase [Agromyces atrinae]|uniref:DNA cytosine methyltransferase n=1 Tax=Agromyces atrinae TaxID=592376 RepID=UPI001F59A97D|nr:DNA cytosine methyltransferase [Agromyces atrinae]MCI2958212.1 DNA cytosine methyltransferase [Agromyces atrinae]